MGWNTAEAMQRAKERIRNVPQAVRDKMTWDEARSYLLPDTLTFASWSGFEARKNVTPYEALCYVNCMEVKPAKEES